MVVREVPIQISADDKLMISSSSIAAFPANTFDNLNTNTNNSSLLFDLLCAPLPPPTAMSSAFGNSSQRTLPFPPPLPVQPQLQQSSSFATPTFGFVQPSKIPSVALPPPLPAIPGFDTFSHSQAHQFQDLLMGDILDVAKTYTPSSCTTTITSPMTTIKKWPSNDQDIVRYLINLQKFDGLWNLTNDDLENLCQKSLTSFHSNITQDSILLTTVIVILFLEKKFNSYQTMWSFMVNKARKRLTELLGHNVILEQLINEINNLLQL